MNTQSTDCRKVADYESAVQPGDYYFSERDGAKYIHVILPDGAFINLPVDGKTKNAVGACWQWDGNEEKPTLHPSIDCKNHWHGWLRNGRLESC